MFIRLMNGDTGCCSAECEFKRDRWCNLFFEELFGNIDNPTRCIQCQQMTSTDASFKSIRFQLGMSSDCFGCDNRRDSSDVACTANFLCKNGELNRYRRGCIHMHMLSKLEGLTLKERDIIRQNLCTELCENKCRPEYLRKD